MSLDVHLADILVFDCVLGMSSKDILHRLSARGDARNTELKLSGLSLLRPLIVALVALC